MGIGGLGKCQVIKKKFNTITINVNMKTLSNHINESLVTETVVNESINSPRNWVYEKETKYQDMIKHVEKVGKIAEDLIRLIDKNHKGIFTNYALADTDMSSFWLIFKSAEFPKARLWADEISKLKNILDQDKDLEKYVDIVSTTTHNQLKSAGNQFALRLKDQ